MGVKTAKAKARRDAERLRAMVESEELTPHGARVALARRRGREDFAAFFRANEPGKPYHYGGHTRAIIRELDRTTKMVERGESRYVAICVPYRHGKSDIFSRRWPVWHLGRNPEHEFMLVGYNETMALSFSRDARRCFRQAGALWNRHVDPQNDSLGEWGVWRHKGKFYATGIGGTVASRGAHVLAVEDHMKNRPEAESATMREKTWEFFADDLMTRRAPVHAVVICANRMHEDDLVGRIIRRNDPRSSAYDPDFPRFEVLRFPAQGDDGAWLFPERFSDQWYRSMRATLGTYAWNAMAQQNPIPRHGNLLKTSDVKILSRAEWARNELVARARWRRGWDLASSKKEVVKDDPDWTVGTKASVVDGWVLVEDEVRGRWRGATRNRIILSTAVSDRETTRVVVETVGGYEDAYDIVREALQGRFVVERFHPTTDKVARATPMEPAFELGHVLLREGDWNAEWLGEFGSFPGGAHDDRIDSLVTAVHDLLAKDDFQFVM